MIEYDEDLKLRSLNIFGFDMDNLDVSKIIHVPMHHYRIATKEQPMLYVENLQVCIGVYAYTTDFGFAAHVNPVVLHKDEYELNYNGIAERFIRIDDLERLILERTDIIEPIKIGISLGYRPLGKYVHNVLLIYKAIDNLIDRLTKMRISVIKLDEINAPEFILDNVNDKIILPSNKVKVKTN